MKFLVHILCFYLLLLVTLPSVRAMKMLASENCEQTCHKTDSESSGCEKGKIIMSLNFSPVQFVAELDFKLEISFPEFKIEKEKSNYERIFIPKYQHSIWHPPKFFI